MWASVVTNCGIKILRCRPLWLPRVLITPIPLPISPSLLSMDRSNTTSSSSFAHSSKRTRVLRHMASELNLNMRSDGYVKVEDLLKLNLKTFANIPLRSHTIDDIREAVRKDNKQRFSFLDENGELLIRANQGHTVTAVETESLLKPILSAEEVPVCVHGTYKKNLESILDSGLKRMKRLHVHFSCGLPTDGEVISGMRRDVNVLIFLDVQKALEDGMKLYISDNRVILTEGFDGVVPMKYFQKIESWPNRQPVPF
ncbi:tRNA 2'-phosphotransferase 1 isoform X2 [Cucumis sativus]|uniref:tRNA 2'-phosphotransferase 1 isoform X2 n=1 Tax=Cucumis sativus TaxID=3659 RepID=UPI0012F4D60C|nr:tRNA 2'-phosphotransferase 1 isoform X2 [Cucumis sativus]